MSLILNGNTGISGVDGTSGTPALQGNDSNTGISFGTDTVTINTAGTARVTTDASGNVGIGTSSPASKLDVRATGATFFNPATTSNDADGFSFVNYNPTTTFWGFLRANASHHEWYVYNTERMRLDSSGNLGLGVTPSAWNSANPAIQFTGEVSISRFGFGRNAYYDGTNYRYITTNVATLYQQSSGNHTWNVAPSGTAGAAISFTQAMTLDASGNLGVGTASPASKLHISAGASSTIQLGDTATTGYYGQINNTSNNLNIIANGDQAYRVSVGTNNGSGNILFFTATGTTGNTERARIDSSGNLLVGTISQISGARVSILNVNAGQAGMGIGNTGGTSASTCISFRNSNGEVGFIQTSGSSTTYSTSSDYRLKENIQPMTGALAKVAALKPCIYTWKADGSDGQGFIAHELQAVCPQAVSGEKDAVDEDGKPRYQGVDTSFLVATLTAAIQEQQTLIQSLTSRLEALENK